MIPGEKDIFKTNQIYQVAISYLIAHIFERASTGNPLPAFFLGSGLQHYLYNRLEKSVSLIKKQTGYRNQNTRLRVVAKQSESFTFQSLSASDISYLQNNAVLYFSQEFGVTAKDFLREYRLNKRISIEATLKPPKPSSSIFNLPESEEIIALAVSLDHPTYFITADLEYTQFLFANPLQARSDPLDHSRPSRKLAQTIANLVAEEA